MKRWLWTGAFGAGILLGQQSVQIPIKDAPAGTPPLSFHVVTPDTVVAVINGKPVTSDWVNRMVAAVPGADQADVSKIDRKQFLERYAVLNLLMEEAEKRKLDQTSPMREKLYYQRLMTLSQAVIDGAVSSIVTDEDRKTYYENTKEQFFRVKLRMIFVPFNPKDPGNGMKFHKEAEAKQLIEKADAKLKAGTDFAKVAEEFSEETISKAKGGLYGYVKRSEPIPEEIKTVVFKLKPGQTSEPVEISNGFYIFKVDESGYAPLDEVTSEVDEIVKRDGAERFMKEASKRAKVEIKEDGFFAPQTSAQSLPAPAPAPPKETKSATK